MLDFVGIGAQKAGTTWIYEQLSRHPDITFPAGKEVHFFDRDFDKGLAWYDALFPDIAGIKQGEITPAYAFLPQEKIKILYELNPNVKLFYSIRHPVERAWSGAMMALRRAELDVEEASDQWFLDHFMSQGSRKRGDYQSCIDRWLSIFPQEQLCLIDFSDIAQRPRNVMLKIARHIGVDTAFYEKIEHTLLEQKIYAGHKGYPNRPKLQKKLVKLYKKSLKQGRNHPLLKDIYEHFD